MATRLKILFIVSIIITVFGMSWILQSGQYSLIPKKTTWGNNSDQHPTATHRVMWHSNSDIYSSNSDQKQAMEKSLLPSKDPPTFSTFVFDDGQTLPYFFKSVSKHRNDKYKRKNTYNLSNLEGMLIKKVTKPKLILFYNPPSWHRREVGEDGVSHCPGAPCQCSHDKTKISQADAVIIDGVGISQTVPPQKYPKQMWILFGLESPVHYGHVHNHENWRRVFNWTMTYRLDSDVVVPYGVLIRQTKPAIKNYSEIVSRKHKSAVWLVSNCQCQSRRGEYVTELQKYYTVDIYGDCGRQKHIGSLSGLKDYKFYFSFENSLCEDYVTEKMFKIYDRSVELIPVVRGSANYSRMFPKGTYIDAAQFASPKQLAAYLHYLESNVTAYTEMLQRKDFYINKDLSKTISSAFCDICIKLHNLESFVNYYTDIRNWLHEDMCYKPKDY